MTAALWRAHFSFNKYSMICARAVRESLKGDARVLAEKRGNSQVRYQQWAGGKGGEQVHLTQPASKAQTPPV